MKEELLAELKKAISSGEVWKINQASTKVQQHIRAKPKDAGWFKKMTGELET